MNDTDTFPLSDENNNIYYFFLFESLSLYSPIKENHNKKTPPTDIEKENEIHRIQKTAYDYNVMPTKINKQV
ncbi:hypothetical protein [Brachyspira hyodysenteriae]|uniref:hypothetical protein n=1 Tax=Brachyspira hyodysenteriae TaxID=159 RepID=UPI0022CD31FD|nr:hypothetical protein [Brachyspira hyodysenteriae]MCZ9966177.1 hypothetical protein [Brachyspira hyodysenteriae]